MLDDEDPRDLVNVPIVNAAQAPVLRVGGSPSPQQNNVAVSDDKLSCVIRSPSMEVTIHLRSFDVAEINASKRSEAVMLRLQGEALRRLKIIKGPLIIEIAGRVFEAGPRTQIAHFNDSADMLLQPVVQKTGNAAPPTSSQAVVVPPLPAPKKSAPVKAPTPLMEEDPGESLPEEEAAPKPLIGDA